MTVAPEALLEACCEDHGRLQRLAVISSHMVLVEKGTFSIHQRAYWLRIAEEQKWIEVFTQIQDRLHDALNIYEAVQYADRSWKPESAVKRLWREISKADPPGHSDDPGTNPAEFIPPPSGGHRRWSAPEAEEIKARLTMGLNEQTFVNGGTQAYVGLAGGTGEVAGQHALERMGLNSTWAWAHNRNMPADLFSTRGSKVIQGMYGNHVNRLTEIITSATDPRNPKTIAEVQREIREEWPRLQRYQVERIARTETAAAWTTVSANAYAANGIGEFESTIAAGPTIGVDSETPCDECVEMITMIQDMSGDIPPWHPNCRCEIVPLLEDPETGEVWLPPDEPWAGGGDALVEGTAASEARTGEFFRPTPGESLPYTVSEARPPNVEIEGNRATPESASVGNALKPGDDLRYVDNDQLDASIYSASNRMSGIKNQIKRELSKPSSDDLKVRMLRARLQREIDFKARMQERLKAGPEPDRPPPPPPAPPTPVPPAEGEAAENLWDKQAGQWLGKLGSREDQAINHYTSDSSVQVNEFLRGDQRVNEEYKLEAQQIEAALSRARAPETITYRGVNSQALFGMKRPDASLVGRTFEDQGFMSTTLSKEQLGSWVSGDTGMSVLRIHVPAGYEAGYVKMLSESPHELEVLIQRGAKFRVTKFTPEKPIKEIKTVEGLVENAPTFDVELLPREPAITQYTEATAHKETTGNLWRAMSRNGKAENAAQKDIAYDQDKVIAKELWARMETDPDAGLPPGTLRYSDLSGEQHLHTTYSDGHNTIKEMAEEARSHGKTRLTVSDHSHLLSDESITRQHAEIDALNAEYARQGVNFTVVKGVEANIMLDGSLDMTAEQLARFDVINAGMHVERASADATERYLKVMDNPKVTTVAHPHTGGDVVDWDKLAKKAAEKNIALEVNGRDILRMSTDTAAKKMIAAAKKYNVKIQIASDAHNDVVMVDTLYAVRFAAKEGVTFDDLLPMQRVVDDVSMPGEKPIETKYLRWIKKLHLDTVDEMPYGARALRILKGAKDTKALHTDERGAYDALAQKGHERAIKEALGDAPAQEHPVALVTAGGPAAGKSVALRANPDMIPEDAVTVNPDEVMTSLTDYAALEGDQGLAAALHEEASDVASDILRAGIEKRTNLVLDGCGNAGEGKFVAKLKALKDAGYEVKVMMSDAPINTAIERSVERAIKDGSPDLGRFLPVRTLKSLYRDAAARIPEWQTSPYIDEWKIAVTTGEWGDTNVVVVAQGGKGQMEILQRGHWDSLMNKAKLDTGPTTPGVTPPDIPKPVLPPKPVKVPGVDQAEIRAKITSAGNRISGLKTRIKRLESTGDPTGKLSEVRSRLAGEIHLRDGLRGQLKAGDTSPPPPLPEPPPTPAAAPIAPGAVEPSQLAKDVAELKREETWDRTILGTHMNTTIKIGSRVDEAIQARIPADIRQAYEDAARRKKEGWKALDRKIEPISSEKTKVQDALAARQAKLTDSLFSEAPDYRDLGLVNYWNLSEKDRWVIRRDPEVAELTERNNDLYLKIDKIYEQKVRYGKQLDEAEHDLLRAERTAVVDTLAEIRRMGKAAFAKYNPETKTKDVKTAFNRMEEAKEMLPTDWIMDMRPINSLGVGGRGFARSDYGHVSIQISSKTGPLPEDKKGMSTALHELGHEVENTNALVRKMERQFYLYRTVGERLRTLPSYKPDEKFRIDEFSERYMGKDYDGNGTADNYELLTMGLEDLFRTAKRERMDPEMRQWLLGVLAIA